MFLDQDYLLVGTKGEPVFVLKDRGSSLLPLCMRFSEETVYSESIIFPSDM